MKGIIIIMKKMIFGVLLSIIGLAGIITIFEAVFITAGPTMHWYSKIISYDLGKVFLFSIILLIAGIAICAVEAFKKPKNNCKSE